MSQEVLKEIKFVDHGEDAINGTPKFKEFRGLIGDATSQIEQEELDVALATGEISLSEFATLASELSKRTKLELKEVKAKLERYGIDKKVEPRRHPLYGQTGTITEVSEDGTQRKI